MKIVPKELDLIPLFKLAPGDVFEYNLKYYLKTEDNDNSINCVSLSGMHDYIEDSTHVRLIKGSFVEE